MIMQQKKSEKSYIRYILCFRLLYHEQSTVFRGKRYKKLREGKSRRKGRRVSLFYFLMLLGLCAAAFSSSVVWCVCVSER